MLSSNFILYFLCSLIHAAFPRDPLGVSFILSQIFLSYSFIRPLPLSRAQLVGAGRFSWLSVDHWDTIEDEE